MSKPAKVRIVFVGVGGMGQCAHLRNYATVPDCDVVAIAELREKTARRVAQRYNVPRVYTDFREMLANESYDAVVASQPFWRHSILLPELIQAGKPVFCEKPLASTIAAGEQVLAAVRQSDTWMMVGYHKRSDPASMFAKAEVDRLKASGELGKLTYVRSCMPAGEWINNGFLELINEGDQIEGLDREPWPDDMDEPTYNKYVGFVNYYIHQVNLLRYFLGEPYRVTHADPAGVLFVGASDSGVPCLIEMSPYKTTVDWQESVLVAFEKGYVRVELPAPLALNRPGRVEILRDPGDGRTPEERRVHLPWVHAMRQQAIHFVEAVQGKRPPLCDAAEAMEDLRVAREYIRMLKGQ